MNDMLETIIKKAEELYPADEAARKQFVDGFMKKTAGIMDHVKSVGNYTPDENTVNSGIVRGITQAAGKAVVGAGAAALFAGIAGMAGAVKNHNLYNKFLQALNEAVQINRVLKGEDKAKILNYGHTIFKFAPHVATDANLLASILANAVHGDGIDPMTIRTLTELESRYGDINRSENFNPKSWI